MPLRLKQKPRLFTPPKTTRPPSRRWLWIWTIILLILGISAALFDFPAGWNRLAQATGISRWEPRGFRLGLDLLGGSELVYEADLLQIPLRDRAEAMEGVRDVIERRVNALGVAEPVVQVVRTAGTYRVIAQLAGIRDVNEAIREIGETPVLEFKEQGEDPEQKAAYEAALGEARERADSVAERLRARPRIEFAALAEEFGLTVNDLGFISEATHPELWRWADEHGPGRRTTTEPVETAVGWHFIEVTDRREEGKEVLASHILICYQGATGCTRDTSKEDARGQIEELRAEATPDNFAELAQKHSTEPGAEESGGSLGWFGRGRMVPPFEDAAFAIEMGKISDVIETQFGFHIIWKSGERQLKEYLVREILVEKPPGLTTGWANTGLSGKHLTRAQVEFDPNTGTPIVSLTFNDEGNQLFGDLTARNVSRSIAIFLDGGIISAPTVQQEIRGGNAIITGDFTIDDAKKLAGRLNAGALPVPIKLISQQTVGAILGQESLAKSLVAGLIGFALVALFMIVYYRVSGVLAVLALGIYVSIVLALFKLIPVTLTLAGIAGVILSIGMAVDANVLIFERMKEELRAGRSLGSAIDEGFKRAWTSIRDGNFTTLIAALVLFWFSSSVIKGFALTLGIGVLMSMFSALAVTKTFMRLAAGWRWRTRLGLFAPFVKKNSA